MNSNTSLSCKDTDDHDATVTRDDAAHLVKVTDYYRGTFTFYDPNYMPPTDPLVGRWAAWAPPGKQTEWTAWTLLFIHIRAGDNDGEYTVSTSRSDGCGSGPDRYEVTQNPDGTKTFSRPWRYASEEIGGYNSFKYNPQTKEITNPNPDTTFYPGFCIILNDSLSSTLFTKW